MAVTRMTSDIEGNGYAEAIETVKRLAQTPQDQWPLLVLLTGKPGSGKTHAATRICAFWSYLFKGGEVEWTTEFILTQKLKFPESPDTFWSVWNRYTNPKLLFIDDLFTERTSAADVANVTELIETRKNSLKYTVITTNRSIPEIEQQYSMRLAERMMEDTLLVLFDAPSQRMSVQIASLPEVKP